MSESPEAIVLVKLGGSLITEKSRAGVARSDVIQRLAFEIAEALPVLAQRNEALIIGHGSGSFGHMAAKDVGYLKGAPETTRRRGVARVQAAASTLHRLVVDALIAAGVECLSLAPASFLFLREGAPVRLWSDVLSGALERDLVVVTHGDVALDETLGWSICSTEALFAAVLDSLAAYPGLPAVREILWMGETEGILDRSGETIARVGRTDREAVLRAIDEPEVTDVTGGMRLRFESAFKEAARGVSSRLLNGLRPGVLHAALVGDETPPGGTLIDRHETG